MMKSIAIKRLAAFTIDYLIIAMFIGLLIVINLFVLKAELDVPQSLNGKVMGHARAFLMLTLPVWLYFTLTESSRFSATLGKRVLKLQVRDTKGGHPTPRRAGLRNAIRLTPWEMAHAAIWYVPGKPFVDDMPTLNLSVCVLANLAVIYFIGSLFFGSGRTMYDRLSGTSVVSP